MSAFKAVSKVSAVLLTLAAMGGVATTAQAQSTKRIVVAMVPTDASAAPEQPAVRATAQAAATPRVLRAKRVALAPAAPKVEKADCFWCNRPVYISGLTF